FLIVLQFFNTLHLVGRRTNLLNLLFQKQRALKTSALYPFILLLPINPGQVFYIESLHNTLRKHSFCNFHESGDICSLYIVHISVFFLTVISAGFLDSDHSFLTTAVHLCRTPVQTGRVLRHFQSRSSYTSCVGSLAR